jgi:SAM-dependent methyltransferase
MSKGIKGEMHPNSIGGMMFFRDNFVDPLKTKYLKILDVGSLDVNGSYKELFINDNWTYQGLDVCEGRNVDIVVKDPYKWTEVESESFDIIISGQAFEHMGRFWECAKEMGRALKEGGLLCIIAPQQCPEHKYPVDCWRFYPDGLRAIADYAGLTPVEVYRTDTAGDTDVMLIAIKPNAKSYVEN